MDFVPHRIFFRIKFNEVTGHFMMVQDEELADLYRSLSVDGGEG